MPPTSPVSRRAVVGTAAWSLPAITVATAAPAMAASGATALNRTTPVSPMFTEDMAASQTISVTLLNGADAVEGAIVGFWLSETTWLRFAAQATTAQVTTDVDGLAATSLSIAPGASPALGDTATLTASYQGLLVAWTITYRPFTALATGSAGAHQLALSGGAAYAWGSGGDGQRGDGTLGAIQSTPVAVTTSGTPMGDKTLTAISAGDSHSLALASDGAVYAWGRGDSGQLGNGSTATTTQSTPVAVITSGTPMADKTITAIAAGAKHNLALDSAGAVFAWGRGNGGQIGNGTVPTARTLPAAVTTAGTPMEGKTITAIAAGTLHNLALDSQGAVYAWGTRSSGRLGNGTTSGTQSTPVAVTTVGTPMEGKTITAIAAGSAISLAVASDGTVYAWGSGSGGKLGNGTTTATQSTPVRVTAVGTPMDGKTIIEVAAGTDHCLALASDGTVYAWGAGSNGQLGNGTTTAPQSTPVLVTSAGTPMEGKSITTIAAGSFNSYALSSDHLAFAWGSATTGALGNGTTAATATTPVKVTVAP
ncbi:RCC1 domain-containing protein [Nocardioides sp.]|uniref:RCC1 domain-containing protein n=1 Tax=Nocardioides sp. TaxID=35761 RepID=UPI0035698103